MLKSGEGFNHFEKVQTASSVARLDRISLLQLFVWIVTENLHEQTIIWFSFKHVRKKLLY